MKQLAFILIISFLYNLPFYQNLMINRADERYEKEFFADAISIYQKVAQYNDSNLHVISKLADSYRMVNDFENAERWYARAVSFDNTDPIMFFYYAEMLKVNQKYDEAIKWMEKYHAERTDDIRALRHVENRNYVEMLKLDSLSIELKYLALNSNNSDFGVSFINENQVLFASTRKGAKFLDRKNKRDYTPFLDIFTADVEDWELVNIRPYSEELSTNLHDGPAVLTKDGKEIFFTRNVYLKRSRYEERINRLMIYSAIFDGEKWTDIEPLPFNSENYSCGHPVLSPDGQKLYFSSDMPGGFGKTDIWVVERIGSDWSDPKNLGKNINTPGREMFPYVHADGTLYFSSDGYATLGGLDILAARSTPSGYENPFNLGYPINSPADDFAFVLSSDGFNGYLSSNRKTSSNDDIYKFSIRPKPPIAVTDYIETDRYVEKVSILPLKNDVLGDGKVIGISNFSKSSVKGGSVSFNPKKQELVYSPPSSNFFGFDTIHYTVCDTFSLYQGCSQGLIAVNVKNVYYGLKGLVVEKGSNTPVSGVDVTLLDENMQTITHISTGETGDFLLDLLKNKFFYVRLVKEGFLTKNLHISTINIAPGVQDILEKIEIEQIKAGISFSLLILFDTGKWNIRPDAAKELDEKALTFLNDNPNVKIELSAHTDSRGSAQSNIRLSQQRAQSAVNYLISKGIDPSRMVAKGYGQEKLLNHCKPGVKCSEEEHQENRRVEVTILSF